MGARLHALATVLCFCALIVSTLAETDQEVAAREIALEVAGAFSNDGFKLRDGHWAGTVAPNETKTFAVNLYSGNQYWFSVATPTPAKELTVEAFDETGAPITTEKYHADGKAAAGLSVVKSGQYFIRVGLKESAPAAVCFVYSYK
ncbi:MAG: hypothetical protein ACRD5Z_18580 [Bryobacteraceae bacterium]